MGENTIKKATMRRVAFYDVILEWIAGITLLQRHRPSGVHVQPAHCDAQ